MNEIAGTCPLRRMSSNSLDSGTKSRQSYTISHKRYKYLSKVLILAYGISSSLCVSAFTNGRFTSNSSPPRTIKYDDFAHKRRSSRSSSNNNHQKLLMSSIDRDDNDLIEKFQSWVGSKLPPPPEDQLSFGGDIGSIFLYTFLDHAVNGINEDYLNSPEVLVSKSASAAIESSFAASVDLLSNSFTQTTAGSSFPVWFDVTSSAPFGSIPLSSALPITHHIHYAPAIETAGMASVLLASTWMICGYFTGAFQLKNTLGCNLSKALTVTVFNWFFTCVIMFAIAYSSDYFVGGYDCLHKSVGVTKADGDFILDSLSVLLVWRFTLNSMLGYGGDDE